MYVCKHTAHMYVHAYTFMNPYTNDVYNIVHTHTYALHTCTYIDEYSAIHTYIHTYVVHVCMYVAIHLCKHFTPQTKDSNCTT